MDIALGISARYTSCFKFNLDSLDEGGKAMGVINRLVPYYTRPPNALGWMTQIRYADMGREGGLSVRGG